MKTFGKKGVWIIFIVLITFMLPNTMIIPGLINTVLPIIAETSGLDLADMLTFSGYIGWFGLPIMILWAKLGEKKGAKFTVVFGLFGCAISYFMLAVVTDMFTWLLCCFVSTALTKGLGYAGPALIANWFPTKKGTALGWATMGVILVDLLWTPYIATPIANIGFQETLWICTGIAALIAIIAWITIKDTPEEAGAFPDNIEHPEVNNLAEKIATMKEKYVSDWPLARSVKSRPIWTIAIATGLFWMASSGPVLCFYARLGEYYDVTFIGTIFVIGALCSLVGSWAFGFLDEKTNSKKALIIFGVSTLISNLVFRFLAPTSGVWALISTIMLFACVGGIPNLQASVITSLWGRWDYSAAAKLIQPVAMFFVMNVSLVMGYCLGWTGNYEFYLMLLSILIIVAIILICTLKMDRLGKTDDEVAMEVFGKTMAQSDD